MTFSLDQLLIFAVRAGNLTVAKERLAQGASPNYLDPVHGSAAMEAVRRGDAEMLGLLLQAGLTSNGPAALDQGGLMEGALHHNQTVTVQVPSAEGGRSRSGKGLAEAPWCAG